MRTPSFPEQSVLGVCLLQVPAVPHSSEPLTRAFTLPVLCHKITRVRGQGFQSVY